MPGEEGRSVHLTD